jgi:putative tryptophan/tyrosine transport system substrate-binding protein
VAKVAQERKLPLFTGETRSVERGAIASIGFDYTAVGQSAAKLVAQVLGGKKPGDLDVVVPDAFRTVVNVRAAQATGVEIPQAVRAKANLVNK